MEGKYRELHRLLLWRQLGPAWDPRQTFAAPEQPLHLEIGFGNGEYLLRQAVDRPEHNFLGLELHWGSVRRALRRLAQRGVENVRLLQVDAQVALHYLLPDRCAEEFVALFPCPWPKREHQRFRLFSQSFMAQLRRVCRGPGLVVTDHAGLRDFALAQAVGSGYRLDISEVEARYNTKYERRWSGQGQSLFYELQYIPEGPSGLSRVAEVAVQTLKVQNFDPDANLEGAQDAPVVQFRQQIFDAERKVWMVLTTVVEDYLNQTFWIEARYHPEDSSWHIRPALGGGYLPTLGVQRALELVQRGCEVAPSG